MNRLYYNADKPTKSGFAFDGDILLQALRNIYARRGKDPTYIEEHLFREFCRGFDHAVAEGFTAPDPDDDFLEALRHSTEVFSAFKVHRVERDMAAQLLDSNGKLKPFEQWMKDVSPIASHQCRDWFQTEYDTAIIRAHQAADWQQFQRERDVLPNLKWMPSTSVHPGADHTPFWGVIRPIDDKFWTEHRPGDRWNCKCSLSSTDEAPTPIPQRTPPMNNPQPGLTGNPGTERAVFSDDHPYFPTDCKHCFAYKNSGLKNRLKSIFFNREKDCCNCPYIDGCIDRASTKELEYKRLLSDPDYRDVHFDPKTGGIKATHVGHNVHDPNDKQRFFGNLTKEDLENECQDLLYKWGNVAILRNEKVILPNGCFASCLDLELNGEIMDIASITEFNGHYGSRLTDKNNQLGRAKKQSGDVSDSLCLYFHDPSLFHENQLVSDMQWYKNFVSKCGSKQRISHVYVVVNGETRFRKYDI